MRSRMFVRKLYKKIVEQSEDRKISLIIGPRQVGKTTILKQLFDEFSRKHKCLFLDLDILSNYEKVSSFEGLLNTIKLDGYDDRQKDFFHLFIDEFQHYPGFVMVLKNIYDHTNNVKVYASGSSSMHIKDQIQESLAGRKIINILFPLDFEEFLIFKQDTQALEMYYNTVKLQGSLIKQLGKLRSYLDEFLIYGGYPEVVLSIDKKRIFESIFDLFIKKDLIDYLSMDKLLQNKRLIELLAVNHGQKIKVEELAASTSLKVWDVKKFLQILSDTHLIYELRPYFTNKNKEIVKMPKIYFIDNGVRNYFINNFNVPKLRADAGILFETFVLSELLKNGFDLRFWQDKNKNEVDFVTKELAIEVKYKDILKNEDHKGLDVYLKEYKAKTFIISPSEQDIKGKHKKILPYNLKALTK